VCGATRCLDDCVLHLVRICEAITRVIAVDAGGRPKSFDVWTIRIHVMAAGCWLHCGEQISSSTPSLEGAAGVLEWARIVCAGYGYMVEAKSTCYRENGAQGIKCSGFPSRLTSGSLFVIR